MEPTNFDRLLIKAAFSCMACDGEIHESEVAQIQKIASKSNFFKELDIKKELSTLIAAINEQGNEFLRSFLRELRQSNLSEKEELQILNVSIQTIEADAKIEYSEIKFLKIIRSKLTVSDEVVLEHFPDVEDYLEQDVISGSYLSNLLDDFLGTFKTPEFEPIIFEDRNNL